MDSGDILLTIGGVGFFLAIFVIPIAIEYTDNKYWECVEPKFESFCVELDYSGFERASRKCFDISTGFKVYSEFEVDKSVAEECGWG